MREKFREYLISQGYKIITPKGKPSTVGDYINRVDNVCKYEGMTYETLAYNIGHILSEYEVGGKKEALGRKSHNAVINALRRFREFIDN